MRSRIAADSCVSLYSSWHSRCAGVVHLLSKNSEFVDLKTPMPRRSRQTNVRVGNAADSQRNADNGVAQPEVVLVPVANITASQRNPRRRLQGVDELAASLGAYGMLQPVLVRQSDGQYELIAGHRRFAAAVQLGWQTIPALVRSVD